MADVVGEAFIRIRPESAGFESELAASLSGALSKSSQALESIAGRMGMKLDEEARQKMAPAGKVVQSAWQDLSGMFSSKLGPAAGAVSTELNKMGTSAITAGSSMATGITAGVAVAGAAVVGFVAKGVSSYESLAGSVKQYMNVTGASAEQSSIMVGRADALKIPVDALARSMALLGTAVNDHPAKFEKYGVAIAHNKNGTVDLTGTLRNLQVAYQGSTDAAEKDAMAKALMGRNVQQLLPLLNASTASIREWDSATKARGDILHQKDIDQALALKRAMSELNLAVQAMARALAKDFVPWLTDTTRGLTTIAQGADQALSHLGPLKNILQTFGEGPLGAIGRIANMLKPAADATGNAANRAAALADAQAKASQETKTLETETDKLDKAQHSLASSSQAVTNAQEALTKAQRDLAAVPAKYARELADAERAWAQSSKAVADAQDNLAKVEEHVNDVLRNTGTYHKDLVDAETALARSTTTLTDAQQRLEDVQQKVNDVMHDAGQFAKDQQHAELALEHAHMSQTQAAKQLTDAQLALQQAQMWGYAPDIAAAQLALEQAQLAVKDATQNTGDAQDRLTQINNQAVPGTKEYETAQKELRDAQQAVQDAATSQINAQDHLNSIVREAIPGTAEYRDLMRQLRDATDNVAQATQHERDAHDTLRALQVGDRDLSHQLADQKHNVDVATRSMNDALWQEAQAHDAVSKAIAAQKDALDGALKAAKDAAFWAANSGGGTAVTVEKQKSPIQQILDKINPANWFAEGGIVGGAIGRPQLAVVHGGEEVLSLDDRRAGRSRTGGDGGDTTIAPVINIHPSPGMDESTIAALTNAELAWQIKAALR